MLKFCYNVARLFVILVGFSTFTAGSIFVTGRYIQELSKPVYVAASKAAFFYRDGHPGSDFMKGAVEHARDRDKLPIVFVPVPDSPENIIDIPMMCFFDADGVEIRESRMSGLWNLYDMNIRFGIEPAL